MNTSTGARTAHLRKAGWPVASKISAPSDAQGWARQVEDEVARGVYIRRVGSERTTLVAALHRYLQEVVPTKRPTIRTVETRRAKILEKHLGAYNLAAITSITGPRPLPGPSLRID